MKIHYIAIAMMAILAGLIIFAKFFVPKEKKLSQIEGEYAEGILGYSEGSDRQKLEELAITIGEKKGLTKEGSLAMLESDLAQRK